jgi:hypothetical protein
MKIRHLAILLPLAAAAVPAQETKPPTAPPHVLIDTVGPDGWRMRLGPTNLGSFLESPQGKALWEPQVVPMLGMWQKLVGNDDMYTAARARLLGYSGRIRIGMWFEDDSKASHVAIVIDGDGRTDLDALAKDLRHIQYVTVPGEWSQQELAGAKVEVRGEGDQLCAPLREGDHLLVAMATNEDLAVALQHARTLASGATGKPPLPNTPALQMQFDLATLVGRELGDEGSRDRNWMRALGLGSLGTAALTLGTAGPHVQFEMSQQFTSDDRGLFAGLFPAASMPPSLVRAVPAGSGSWKAGHFDVAATWRAIEQAIIASDAIAQAKTVDELRAEMREELGIDLLTDLLDHMSDDVLLTGALRDGDPEATMWSLTFGLRDAAKFQQGLTTMLPKLRPTLQREATEQHGDIEVHRYGNFLSYDLWMAVGNGVFVLAGGKGADAHLKAVLDGKKALPKEPAAALELPKGFEALRRFTPPGCNGFGMGDVGSVVSLPSEAWLWALDEVLPMGGPGRVGGLSAEQREEVLATLRQHQLDVLRTATGYADRTWRWRMFW